MAKEKKVEVTESIVEEKVVEEHDTFLERKLKAINEMKKPEKAEKLAHRLLRKARNN